MFFVAGRSYLPPAGYPFASEVRPRLEGLPVLGLTRACSFREHGGVSGNLFHPSAIPKRAPTGKAGATPLVKLPGDAANPNDGDALFDAPRGLAAASAGGKTPDLELLEIIERSPEVTQRHIANEMRIALGLANSYLKQLARKGWIKVRQIPGRRWLYYLTPQGMAVKTRLTYEYARHSARFYGEARTRCRNLFRRLIEQRGARRFAFLGWSDLSEIAYLTLLEFDVEFVDIFDRDDSNNVGNSFFGRKILSLADLEARRAGIDVIIYTRMAPPSHEPKFKPFAFEVIF